MKNLLYLFSVILLLGCDAQDIPDDNLADPSYFLNGTLNGEDYEIFAGDENMTISTENYLLTPNVNTPDDIIGFVGYFHNNVFCQESCNEQLEIQIMAPEFNLNSLEVKVEEVFMVDNYAYDYLDGQPEIETDISLVRIIYTNEQGENFYSVTHENLLDLEFKITSVQRISRNGQQVLGGAGNEAPGSAKLEIEFDCDLYDGDNNLLQFRNMQGVILLGNFWNN